MTASTVWDGVRDAYIPSDTLDIHPSVQFHDEVDEVDVFLFEILRHNLWTINDEHGATLKKVSGSPIASNAEDFQTALLTENAEFVYFGPRVQLLSAQADLAIKWTLENRSSNPGINDGDMYLCNDPWVGASHQSDVSVLCPVFWDDKIFCWVANALHQYDLGGTTAGGFSPDAENVFMESVCVPPVKIYENGELRSDVVDFYLRHSRMPDLVALDLRAQVASCNVASTRIQELARRYGPGVVKGAMRKIIDDCEQVVARRIEQLPDGVFRARSYAEVALPGDRGLYPLEMQIEKRGSKLIFSMEGTADQVGALNVAYSSWRGAVLGTVNPLLAYDQLYASGGLVRCIELRPTPGTMLCASRPASVAMTQVSTLIACALCSRALSTAMLASPELARHAFAPSAGSTFPVNALEGIDQRGKPFGTFMLDPMLGGLGAFSFRDGIDTGGVSWAPRSLAPNIEDNEQQFPILYLYRREWQDSGGAGRWRGGNSGEAAYVAHGTDAINQATAASGMAVATSEGVLGGLAASPSRFRYVERSDVRAAFASGRVPATLEEISGDHGFSGPKEKGRVQGPDDVRELAWCAAGGMGDPLERNPDLVARDVERGAVSASWAERTYGVIVRSGDVDVAATEQQRDAIRQARAAGSVAPAEPGAGLMPEAGTERVVQIWDVLEISYDEGAEPVIGCASCRTVLSTPGHGYRDGCSIRESPMAKALPHMEDTPQFVDDDVVYREFFCPGCQRLLSSEIARSGDAILVDIEVATPFT
jgi:N-methylhydantoinase B